MKKSHDRVVAFAAFAMLAFCLHARQNVTYIDGVKSAGTQSGTASWVLLNDIKPTGMWKIMVDFSVGDATRTMAIFSCKKVNANNTYKRLNLYNISGKYRLDMLADNGTGIQYTTGVSAVSDFRQTFVYDAGELYLDGARIADASSKNNLLTSDNCEPIAIFGDQTSTSPWFTNFGTGFIFRVRMWDEDGAEVCDLHPCLDSEGVAALYDSINDRIHYSKGKPFTAGKVIPPEGVEFIEYVQTKRSDTDQKGQWFNTGVIPDYRGRIEVECESRDESSRVYPVWRTYTLTGGTRALSIIVMGQNGMRCDLGSNVQSGRVTYTGVRRTYAYDAGVFSVDGNVVANRSSEISGLAALDNAIVLGATYDLLNTAASPEQTTPAASTPANCNANFSNVRIYRFRYWDADGNLKSDLRPARDTAGTAALYDTVRGKFIYHSYGGKDAYDAAAYADYVTLEGGGSIACTSANALEYVETEGNVEGGRQFFDTGFVPSGAAKFEMNVKSLRNYTGANYAFFTDRSATSPASANKLNLYCLQDSGLRFDVNGVQAQTGYKPGTNQYVVSYNAGVLKFNDTQVWNHSAAAETMSDATNRLFLFASGKANRPTLEQSADSNFAKARLYGMKIWDRDGGTLLRDFEPRLDAAGIAGLYDKVGDKFYHSCSNEAVAGPRIGMPTQAQIDAASGVMNDAVFSEDGANLAARSAFVQDATGPVVCPYAGKTRTIGYAHFPQVFSTTASGGDTLVSATTGYAPLGAPFASSAGTSWTAVVRVRREVKGLGALMDTVLSLGTECDKDRVQIGFSGTEATRRLDVRVGRYEWPELAGVLAPAGEWLDVAVVADASASSVRVALCRSGAEPVWMEKTFAVDGASLTNMAARATWNVKLGGVANVAAAEAGRISSEGKWTMFDEPLEAFKGDVQQIALWNRALSDAEVLAAFSQIPPRGFRLIIK